MSAMRLDLLITELNVGGAEKMLTELAIGMHRRGHQVRVISIGSEPQAPRGRLVERLRDHHVRVLFGGFDHWSRFVSARQWLAKQFRVDPADVCQSFLFHANCLASLAQGRDNIRHFVAGIRVAERKRLRVAIERQRLRQARHVVCVSEQVRSFTTDCLSVDPHACSVIPNGVDPQVYQQADRADWSTLGWPGDSDVALFVGRLHPQKGLELIQQHFGGLLEKSDRRRLLIVGDGPLRSDLERWADECGPDRVRVLPWQRDVVPLMKASRFLVLPSHYEGMPNVVLEAMAAGLPVVCSRVEGSEELLGDEATPRGRCQGFRVADGTAMSDLADSFFQDHELASRIGHANLRHVEQHFTIGQMVDRYERLYRSLDKDDSGHI